MDMARIDVSKIEGYEEMSAEDKLNALLGYEFEVSKSDTDEKLKEALSKANTQAAEWKRKFRETQTEQERQAAEAAEEMARVKAENAEWRAKERVSSYANKLMAAGVDAETANVMANSLPEGVGDDYFAAYKSFIEAKTKEIESAALLKQPGLSVGAPPTAQQAEAEETNKMRQYFGLPPIK
jgi:hypothetical protein